MSFSRELKDFWAAYQQSSQVRHQQSQDAFNDSYKQMQMMQMLQSNKNKTPDKVTDAQTLANLTNQNMGGGVAGHAPASMTPPANIKAIIDQNVPEAMRPYAYQVIGKESTFDPNNTSTTGCKGLAQFSVGTGKQYGLVTTDANGHILTDTRDDPVANVKAFVRLTNDNSAGLQKNLGRTPTWSDLAVAHQQGLAGATALLSGKGGVDADALRVNNIAPTSSNAQAVAHINSFYGLPNTPVTTPMQAPAAAPAALPSNTVQATSLPPPPKADPALNGALKAVGQPPLTPVSAPDEATVKGATNPAPVDAPPTAIAFPQAPTVGMQMPAPAPASTDPTTPPMAPSPQASNDADPNEITSGTWKSALAEIAQQPGVAQAIPGTPTQTQDTSNG